MRQIRFGDVLATFLAVAAAGLYVGWASGVAFADMSTRDVAATVFLLGFAGCITDQTRMADVYGVSAQGRAPLWYIAAASVLGALALVSGILAMALGSDVMTGVLTTAVVLLWALATGRHAHKVQPRASRERHLHAIR